jgi:hypothetical protein
VVGVSLLLALVAVAAGFWFWVLHSPGTRVDLSQALRMYQEDQKGLGANAGVGRAGAPGSRGGSPLFPSGVYRYRTGGGEALSVAGISRRFPDSSEMIVTDAKGDCVTMKWVPLEQHTEGLVLCPSTGGSLAIASAPSYEDIAGIQNTSVIRCPPATYFVPPKPTVGKRWQNTCRSSGQPVALSGQVVGLSTLRVGEQMVPAMQLRLVFAFSGGSERGTNPNTYWISLDDGIILKQRETVDISQSAGPLGSVRYSEQMHISLDSLDPVR